MSTREMVEHEARTSDCQPSYNRDDDYLDSLPYDIASVDLTRSSSVAGATDWADKDCICDESLQLV